MVTKVGAIEYDVTLDTGKLIDGSRQVKKELDGVGAAGERMSGRLKAVSVAVAALGVVMAAAAAKSARMADDMRLLGAKVEVAAGSMESGAAAMAALEDISKRTRTSMAANVEVFTRLNQSLLQMGGTQQDTLNLTELLGKAITVSGASAVEAKSAMLQFGQALGSGKLAGDELRSLLENAPYLMRQLADGLGVPIGALKKMGEAGELTAEKVTNALTKSAAQISADFEKFPQTIASAMDVASDAADRANLKLDELTGTSTALTGVAKGTGEAFDELAKQLGAVNDQAGILGKNEVIKQWANDTKIALSYLIDGADILWQTLSVLGRNVAFVFNGVGKEIGGIGAQVAAVMRGDFAGAKAIGDMMVADSAARRAALDAADKKTLGRAQTMGAAMREAWAVGAGGGRGFVNPKQATGTLKAPPGSGGGGKGSKTTKASDADKYLESLQKQIEKEQELTAVQQLGIDINEGRLGKLTPQKQQELILLAQKVDATRAETAAQEEGARIYEDAVRQSEAYRQSQIDGMVSMQEANASLRLHVEEIGLTKEALAALELQRIDDAIAIQQQAAAQLEGIAGEEAEIERIQRVIQLLKDKRNMTADGAEKQMSSDFAKELHGDVKSALSQAFRDTKDPIGAFGDALANVIYTRAANAIADALATQVLGGGGDIFTAIGSFLSFDGGGHTGNGPRTGGVDGKGGFLSILHPQETVTDHTKGSSYRVNAGVPEMLIAPASQAASVASGQQSMTVNIQPPAGYEAKTQQRSDGNGSNILDVMFSQIDAKMAAGISQGNSKTSGALAGTYGLNRVAGSY